MEIKTEIIINAKPSVVWEVFTDFQSYPQWNPFVKSLTGEVKEGNQIKIELPGMNFKPVVLTLEENKELTWLGHLWFKGLFDGEHSFQLTDNGDGTTKFEQSEIFSGILLPLFKKNLLTTTKDGFEAMNKELKARVENS